MIAGSISSLDDVLDNSGMTGVLGGGEGVSCITLVHHFGDKKWLVPLVRVRVIVALATSSVIVGVGLW